MKDKDVKTILIADDIEADAALGRRILEKHGYKIICSDTGEKAIETVNSTPGINLILMDLESGSGIDGADTAELILKTHDIPIIFITSHAEPAFIAKTGRIASYGYIMKSSPEAVIIASIRTAFRLFEDRLNERKKDEIYKSVMAVSNTGAWEFNFVTGAYRCNDEYYKMLGLDPDVYTGCDYTLKVIWEELIHPDDRENALRSISDYIVNGNADIYENYFRMLHADGKWIWIYSRGRNLKNKSGNRTNLIIGTHIDITKLKHAEEIIREKNEELISLNVELSTMNSTLEGMYNGMKEREEKYRNLFMNSQIGIFRTEIDSGLILEVNDRFALLFGFKDREEVHSSQTSVVSFYHDKSVREKVISYMRKHGEIRNYDAQFKRKDGSLFWIRYSCRLVAEKGWIEGVFEDITDFKSSEAERNAIYNELLTSEKKYRLIFENSTLGLHHFNKKGVITHCNSSFERITGAAWSDLIGLDLLGLPDKNFVAAVNEALSGRSGNYEGLYHFTTSDRIKLIRVQFEAIYDENESITGGVGLVEDITDKRAAERSILEELEKERSRIGHILHDSLGQKLGAVLYLTQAFYKKYDKTGKLLNSDMQNLVDLASSALEETRTLSRGLDLPAVDIGNFSDSVEQIGIRIRSIYEIELDIDVDDSINQYDQLKLVNLYFIVLESINNAIRHGKAEKIMLGYYMDKGRGFFTITSRQKVILIIDNPGMGLRIMKYRAETSGMEFTISSDSEGVVSTITLGDVPGFRVS